MFKTNTARRPLALALAALLTSTASFSTSASARTHRYSAPANTQQAPAQPIQYVGRDLDEVMVEGDKEEINHRTLPPDAPRYLAKEQRHTEVYRYEWRQKGWSDASFDAMRHTDESLCVRTTQYIARADVFLKRNADLSERHKALLARYDGMVGTIDTATKTSYGTNVGSSLLGLIFGPGYAGLNALGQLGDAAKTHAWGKSMYLQNDAGRLSAEDHILYGDVNEMWLETYQDYLAMVSGWCSRHVIPQMAANAASSGNVTSTDTQAPTDADRPRY